MTAPGWPETVWHLTRPRLTSGEQARIVAELRKFTDLDSAMSLLADGCDLRMATEAAAIAGGGA